MYAHTIFCFCFSFHSHAGMKVHIFFICMHISIQKHLWFDFHFISNCILMQSKNSKLFSSSFAFIAQTWKIHFFLKMLKLSIVFLLCAIVRVKAPISIDMTPIELQSIGEVLVESYFHHNLIQRVRTTRSIVFTCIRIGGSFFFSI